MLGYLDDQAATREAIDGAGFLHTRDIGIMDEHGYLRITDRMKDMFIVGGFNCYPAEIENFLSRISVMLTMVSVNTNGPAMAMAWRTAQLISEDYA